MCCWQKPGWFPLCSPSLKAELSLRREEHKNCSSSKKGYLAFLPFLYHFWEQFSCAARGKWHQAAPMGTAPLQQAAPTTHLGCHQEPSRFSPASTCQSLHPWPIFELLSCPPDYVNPRAETPGLALALPCTLRAWYFQLTCGYTK